MPEPIKICSQTNIPEVDNSAPDCDDITKEQCVVATKARTVPFVINEGDSYREILDTLLLEIKTLQDRLTVAENKITILETP